LINIEFSVDENGKVTYMEPVIDGIKDREIVREPIF